jgi:hypothetical protein
MCKILYFVYILILLIACFSLLFKIICNFCKIKKGKFSSIDIFDPTYASNGVYILNEIEPVILKISN